MSLRDRLVLPIVLSGLAILVGCGSSTNNATPPPTGGFTNSNLKGTYVFSFSGTDSVDGGFYTMVGTLVADGSGGFSASTADIVDQALGVLPNQAISGGNYKITADGRGSGTLNTAASNTPFAQVGIDFVLTSSSHGLITRFDNNGGGSGTIDLQDSSLTQSSLGSYAFSFSGFDASGNPSGTAGAFTLNGTGIITAGLQDFNDNRNSTGLANLSLGGSVLLGAAGAPGTAQLAATGSPYGTLSFDVWPIDNTHLKLIETDGVQILEGDAFTQQTSISSGQLVYTMAGLDSGNTLLSAGGYMNYDGSSVIGPNGLEDINDDGTIGQSLTVGGTLTVTGGGRYQLVLSGIYNGGVGVGTYTFAAYPSNSGILLLEIDDAGITAGTAFVQSATTFAPTQGYALNLTGANAGGSVDDIAEFTANSDGTLSKGLIDENVSSPNGGLLSFDQQLGSGGTYTFDSPATGRGLLSYPATNTTFIGALTLNFYVVDSSNVIMIDVDSGAQAGVGVFQTQLTPASAGLARTSAHFSMLKTAASKHSRREK